MGCKNRDIPNELVPEILSRLPAKDVIRFRCVSKSFNALIGSRYFIHKHYNVRNNSTRCIFFYKTVPRLYTLHFNDTEDIKLCKRPLMRFPKDTQVLRFCNGLFLIQYSKTTNKYAILNQSTGERKELPKSSMSDRISHVIQTDHGFCYDSVSDDYKVVLVYLIRSMGRMFNGFEVYSLKSNSWRYFKQDYAILSYKWNVDVFVGGALHWLGIQIAIPLKRVILSFDVNTGESKVMLTPNYSTTNVGAYLMEFEGCLSLGFPHDDLWDLWLMNDYRVQESWIKLFSTSFTQSRLICPLAYSKSGTKIFCSNGQGRIMLYDLTNRTIWVKSHSEVCVNEYANSFVENIVRLSDYGGSNNMMPHGQEELKIQQKGRFRNMVKYLVCFKR